MDVTFELGGSKARENVRKHAVDFEEAASAFLDPLSLTIPDPEHSSEEPRWILLGHSAQGRLLVVVHTDRRDTIRLISARAASRTERRTYEHT